MNSLEFTDVDKYLLAQKGRIIHQVWFGTIPDRKEASKTYEKFKIYRNSWKIKNPTWCHMEWSKELSNQIVSTYFPEHYDMYIKYPYEIQRCDLVRYFCLYRYGGIYADMDYYCNKSFDEAFKLFTNSFYLVNTPNVGNSYVSNSLMYSEPGHVFWRRLFVEMEMNKNNPIYYSRHLIIMYSTGPGILTRVYNKYKIKDRLKSLPSKLFHPHGIGDNIMSLKDNKVYAIHIGKGSWEKKDSKILIYFYKEWRILFFVILVILLPIILYSIFIGNNNNYK
jgi:mannosyltransferase OCH1-like enzyme